MTIWDLPTTQSATISSLAAGIQPQLNQRLAEMGFNPGQFLKCIRRAPFKGPLVIQIQDSVYSIDKQIAELIYVSKF